MKKEILLVGFCIMLLVLIYPVFAERISLQIERFSDDTVNFKATLYDNNNNKIIGEADYVIKDYYDDIVEKGKANSGERISFRLPKNPSQGPWKINASYKDRSVNELFNVGDIERADIRLEKDNLIIENTGNVAYDNNILIIIGEGYQNEKVYLAVGEIRKLRLTAPAGDYTVKIDDGSGKENLVFNRVSLTGNVIGLENVIEGNFLQKYPLVSVFLVVVLITFFILSFIMKRKVSVKSKKKRK